jgi:methionyl-tRNA formyltransferase
MSFKILFMGTPDFAIPVLKSLHESNHSILEIFTQPPQKKGRGQKIQNSPIHNFAIKLNIPVICPTSIEKKEIVHIKKLNPDIVIVVAYGKILPPELLKLENILFLNVHASLLPRWRGAAPIQRAIMNMDKETGISIMKIMPKLDAGPVLIQSKIQILENINHEELSNQMSILGSKLLLDSLKLIKNKKVNFIEQNHSRATYANKIEKFETQISWNEEAEKIIAKINAFNPRPGCWFSFFKSRIKIIKAKEIINSGEPGTILDNKFTIACSKNAIQILELKKEGKQKITTEEFLRGHKIKIGQKLTKDV